MKELFIVVEYRHGNHKSHSYVHGVFDSLALAGLVGKWHGKIERGSYEPEIIKVKVPDNQTFVISLTETIGNEHYQYNFFTSFNQGRSFNPKLKHPKLIKHLVNTSNDYLDKKTIESMHLMTSIYNQAEVSLLRDLYEKLIRQGI